MTVEDQWTFGLYNNVSVVYNGAQQGLLSFEIKGFVANESVASGNATVALTYTNTDYTLVGSKYTLNVDKSTNEGQYGVSFTLEANNYAARYKRHSCVLLDYFPKINYHRTEFVLLWHKYRAKID